MPQAQMGPLSLVVAGLLPHPLYVVVLCALFPVFIWMIHRAAPGRIGVWHVAGAVLVGYPWHRFAITGHLDDALVLIAALGLVDAKRRRSPWSACGWFVLGLAAKPTAVMFLPLVFLVSRRAGLVAIAGAGLVYLPFVAVDVPGFLHAGRGVIHVMPYSVPAMLGEPVGEAYPFWIRPAQLVGSLFLCWLLARRGAAMASVVAAYTWRTIPEPGMFAAYCTSVMGACLGLDVLRRRVPWMTELAMLAWLASTTASSGFHPLAAAVRLVALVGILAWSSVDLISFAPLQPGAWWPPLGRRSDMAPGRSNNGVGTLEPVRSERVDLADGESRRR
jgi:hypothetical protein